MYNPGNHKKNMENLENSIKNFFELEENKISLSKVNSFFEENLYNNILILSYDNYDDKLFNKYIEKDSFLGSNKLYNITVPKNTNEGIKHLDIINKINSLGKYKAYGFYKDSYKNIEDISNIIYNLCETNDRKLIYVNFNGLYTNNEQGMLQVEEDIHNIYRRLDKTLIIVTGESEKEDLKIPLCVISRLKDAKKVRSAKVKDYNKVYDILKDSCIERMNKRNDLFMKCGFFTRNEFINYVERGKTNTCFVYELDEEVVGFVLFKFVHVNARQYMNDRSFISIDYICVNDKYRRQGIATELYNEVIEYSKKMKIKRIEFEVWYTDEELEKFVKSLNFNIMSKRYEMII